MRVFGGIAAFLLLASCTSAPDTDSSFSISSEGPLTSTRLEVFGSAEEFDLYRRQVFEASQEVNGKTPDYCPDDDCAVEEVIVTGSRITSNPSVTNNQKIGVEEGDIVKQIDDFLIVLQDGRLFSINIKPDGSDGLQLVDRQEVYRSSSSRTWYDEMLVTGRSIVVTGYSYDAKASETTILTLSESGEFELEDTFFISSDDYFDTDNYATRIIGDRFILHTPIYLGGYQPWNALPWPVVRRWRKNVPMARVNKTQGLPANPLIRPADIYRPVQDTISPMVHMVTICDIGANRAGRQLDCKSTAFVAPEGYELYVSKTDVFIWAWPDDEYWRESRTKCREIGHSLQPIKYEDAVPAMVFKVSIKDHDLKILEARGRPFNQFGIDTQGSRLRALIDLAPRECTAWAKTMRPSYFSVSTRQFGTEKTLDLRGENTSLPSFASDLSLENRFTDNHLVYSLSDRSNYRPEPEELDKSAVVTIVPVDKPSNATEIMLEHSALRLERLANHAVLTGYKNAEGLSVSLLSLAQSPAISSTVVLENRFESEGRSHAFNAIVKRGKTAYLGIPTILRPENAGRWWWNSESSDVSFLSLSPSKQLTDSGALISTDQTDNGGYQCEVSCTDWYGNSRPIFTDNRIFALSGLEVIEGRLVNGLIKEHDRLRLTTPLPSIASGSSENPTHSK